MIFGESWLGTVLADLLRHNLDDYITSMIGNIFKQEI